MPAATATVPAAPATVTAAPRRRNDSIEGLRAVGALLVLLTHVSLNSFGNRGGWGRWLARMDVGVPIFFVISGFLLYRPFARALLRGTDRPGARRYLRHRLLRIVPLYWVVVAVSFLFAPATGLAEGSATHPQLWTMFRFATFTQVYWKDSLAGPFPQAWTLAVEMSFYLFLPVLAWLLARRPPADREGRLRRQALALGAMVVVAQIFRLAVVALAKPYDTGQSFTQQGAWLPNHLDVFALGMGLAVLAVELEDGGPGARLAGRFQAALSRPGGAGASWALSFGCFAISAVALGLSTTALTYGRGQEFSRHWAYAGTAFFLVLPAIFGPHRKGLARRFLASRPMQFAGRISYGIYLWQVLVIGRWVSTGLVRPFPPARHPGQQFNISFWSTLAWAVIVTVILATLSWFLVERPWLRFKDRKLSRFATGMWVIGIGSFGLRLWAIGTATARNPDGGDPFFYHQQANMVASGLGFNDPFIWTAAHRLVPTAIHPPLFTLWLTPASLIGARGFLSHKTMAILAGIGVVIMAGLLAKRLAGTRAGLLAAALTALYPDLWVIDGILWPEGLYTLLVGAVLVGAYRWMDKPSWRWTLGIGALVGLAALARGEALFLLPLLVAPMVLSRRALPWPERLRHLGAVAGVAVVVLAPWTIRNLATFDEPVALSTNSEEVLYYANCPDVYSGPQIGYWSFNCQQRYRAVHGNPPGDQATQAKFWRRLGVQYALDHTDRWPAVAVARVDRVWDLTHGESNATLLQFEGRPQDWNPVGLWVYRALLIPAIGGVILLRRRRERVWPLLMMGVMVTVTALYAYGSVRFRTPGDLAILALAGVAIDALLPGGARHRRNRVARHAPDRSERLERTATGEVVEPAPAGVPQTMPRSTS